MTPKPGYADISEAPSVDGIQYADNPTDIDCINDEIPKFDAVSNLWIIPSLGISYSCLTMKQNQYIEDTEE